MMSKKSPQLRFEGFTDDWEQRKLGDVGKTKSGIGFPDAQQGGKQGTPFYKVSDMNNPGNEVVMMNANNYASDSQLKENKWNPINPQNSGVVFAKVGAAIFLDRKRIVDTSFLIDNNMMSYLFDSSWNRYFGKTLFEKLRLSRFAQVGALPSFNGSDVEDIKVMIPEESEQKMIGDMFEKLDDIIALHQRKLDLLKEQKKGFLQKMFPKNGEKVPELRFAGFADDWEERKLGDLLKEFSIKSTIENEYKVLSSTNSGMEFREGRVSGTSNLGYKIIKNGDLVLSPQNLWLGNININNLGKGLVSPSYKTFELINIDSSFINPQLRTQKMLEEYKNSSTQGASVVRRNLEIDSFYQIKIFVPTISEQEKIGSFFKQLDNTIALHQRKCEQLKELKKFMLQNMFPKKG